MPRTGRPRMGNAALTADMGFKLTEDDADALKALAKRLKIPVAVLLRRLVIRVLREQIGLKDD